MGNSRHGIVAVLALLAGVALCYLGMSVPAHFRAISPHVLVAAGKGSLSVEDFLNDAIDTGKVGLVRTILRVDAHGEIGETHGLAEKVERIEETHPMFALTG